MHSVELAEQILAGRRGRTEDYLSILSAPEGHLMDLLHGADMLRNHAFGRGIHLCTICNGKSGKCSEDCGFCSQSRAAKTEAPEYPLMPKEELQKGAQYALETPIHRYSIVTSGRGLPKKEIRWVAEAIGELDRSRLKYCVSLGIIAREEMRVLKDAGVTRYHHNLETARSHFDTVCTTHTFEQRVETIRAAQEEGLSVCAGGLFGLGESDEQVLELAMTLKELDVDAIPINFLSPIPGTRFEHLRLLTPLRCLRILALFRFVLPTKEILVCGGREYNLKNLHPLIFHAGASGVMTGNYLTTAGRTLDDDLAMLEDLEFQPR